MQQWVSRRAKPEVQVGASVGTALLSEDISPAEAIRLADRAMYARKEERKTQFLPAVVFAGVRAASSNNIGRELILDAADLVPQDQFAVFQALDLDKIGTGRGNKGPR